MGLHEACFFGGGGSRNSRTLEVVEEFEYLP